MPLSQDSVSSALSIVLAMSLPLPRLIASTASVPWTRSLPSPAFRTVLMRPATPLAPLIRSLPALASRWSVSVVPMSTLNAPGPGAGEPVEQHAAGGRGRLDREPLVGVRAVDQGGVVAGAALVEVVVVTAVPDDRVVALAAARVVARAGRVVVGDDPVVAGAAVEQVGGVRAVERVVAVAALDVGAEPERRDRAVGGERVVAAVGVQVEHLGRDDVDVERAGPGRRRAVEGRVTRRSPTRSG